MKEVKNQTLLKQVVLGDK